MNKKFIAILFIFVFFGLFAAPSVHSAGLVPCGTQEVPRPCHLCDFIVMFKNIFDYARNIAIVIVLLCITFGGIMYIVSTGNEKMMESAKSFISASLIGFTIIFVAWLIVNEVIYVMGANQTTLSSGTGAGSFSFSKWWSFTLDCSFTATSQNDCDDQGGSCASQTSCPVGKSISGTLQCNQSGMTCCLNGGGGGGNAIGDEECTDKGYKCVNECTPPNKGHTEQCSSAAYCCETVTVDACDGIATCKDFCSPGGDGTGTCADKNQKCCIN